jgi:hypothetical protein
LVEDRDDEPAANLLGAAGGRTRDFRWRMASDGAGAPAGFGWGGGIWERRDLAGAFEAALAGAAAALAWPRWRQPPWLGRVLAWRRRGPGGAAVEMGIGGGARGPWGSRGGDGDLGGGSRAVGLG